MNPPDPTHPVPQSPRDPALLPALIELSDGLRRTPEQARELFENSIYPAAHSTAENNATELLTQLWSEYGESVFLLGGEPAVAAFSTVSAHVQSRSVQLRQAALIANQLARPATSEHDRLPRPTAHGQENDNEAPRSATDRAGADRRIRADRPEADHTETAPIAVGRTETTVGIDFVPGVDTAPGVDMTSRIDTAYENAAAELTHPNWDDLDLLSIDELVTVATAKLRVAHRTGRTREVPALLAQLADRMHESRSPSRSNESRFRIEAARASLARLDLRSALDNADRATAVNGLLPGPTRIHLGTALALRAAGEAAWGHGTHADAALRSLANLGTSTQTQTSTVEHSRKLAEGIRALDQLDIEQAVQLLGDHDVAEDTTTWAAATIADVSLGILTGEAHRRFHKLDDLLRLNEHHFVSNAEALDALLAARIEAALASGKSQYAQRLTYELTTPGPAGLLASARVHCVTGDHDAAQRLAARAGQEAAASLRVRARAAALGFESQWRSGDTDASPQQISAVLDQCLMISSVLPLALLSREARARFITESSSDPRWYEIALSFGTQITVAQLHTRLLDIGDTFGAIAPVLDITPADSHLLTLLATGSSIAEISRKSGLVTGTTKNKLSALYQKLGVKNRHEAVDLAYQVGYFVS